MKVLHIFKAALPESTGGVEVFMDTLCRMTAPLGVDNTILTLAKQPQPEPFSYHHYQIVQAKQQLFIASTGFSFTAGAWFKKLTQAVDLIHYHFPNPFADLLQQWYRPQKPSVITYHSDIVKQKILLKLYQPLMHRFLRAADHIVATSPNYVDTSSTLQQYVEKVSVIPIGIDKQGYPPVEEERLAYWRRRITQPFFLFIGALRYYKGLHTALAAVRDTDISLVIGGEGAEAAALKAQASDNVTFLGAVTDADKVALLTLCQGFVFPSHLRSEAFGIALLEAAAFGKPLISCEIGTGTSFINQHEQTGIVIPPESPEALRAAMQRLLEHPEQAVSFGNNAQNHYESHFTATVQAQAYYRLYQTLLKRGA